MNTLNWSGINIDENDLDLIYNRLLEEETPMTPAQLAESIIAERIKTYKKSKKETIALDNNNYRPKNQYNEGDTIAFPKDNGMSGIVTNVRKGINPEIGSFDVITVEMQDGSVKEYASNLQNHLLNDYDYDNPEKNLSDPAYVNKKFGRRISQKISEQLHKNSELVRIGSFWFPQALLSEVNMGFLNLAEAVLEMEEGRPLLTSEIMEQIEYPIDSNSELSEFSFNYALHQDDRFAEVGPHDKILWTLKEMQPEDVRKIPMTLKCSDEILALNNDETIELPASNIQDELDSSQLAEPLETANSFAVCLNYPHWKAGTLPLIGAVRPIFPTANETDNVIFTFHDKKTDETFPGWVILSKNYVCGLKQWYRSKGLIPGSLFNVSVGEEPGVIDIELIPPRASKDWIRGISIDEKNHFSFITKQYKITTEFDERLVIYVENDPRLDTFWEFNNRKEANFQKQVDNVIKEIAKDSPQGIVQFNEIYAGVNMLRRIPPKALYTILENMDKLQHIDRLTYKFEENDEA